jgi:hypothetical protein
MNLLSLLRGPLPTGDPKWVWKNIPADFVDLPHSVTLLADFILILIPGTPANPGT